MDKALGQKNGCERIVAYAFMGRTHGFECPHGGNVFCGYARLSIVHRFLWGLIGNKCCLSGKKIYFLNASYNP